MTLTENIGTPSKHSETDMTEAIADDLITLILSFFTLKEMMLICTTSKRIYNRFKDAIRHIKKTHIIFTDYPDLIYESHITAANQINKLWACSYALSTDSFCKIVSSCQRSIGKISFVTNGCISSITLFPYGFFKNVIVLDVYFPKNSFSHYWEYAASMDYSVLRQLPSVRYIKIPLFSINTWTEILNKSKTVTAINFADIDWDIYVPVTVNGPLFSACDSLTSLTLLFDGGIGSKQLRLLNGMFQACRNLQFCVIKLQSVVSFVMEALVAAADNIIKLPKTLIGLSIDFRVFNYIQFNISDCINLKCLELEICVFRDAANYPPQHIHAFYQDLVILLHDYFRVNRNSNYTGKIFLGLCIRLIPDNNINKWDIKTCALQLGKMIHENNLFGETLQKTLKLSFDSLKSVLTVHMMQFFAENTFDMHTNSNSDVTTYNGTLHQFTIVANYLANNPLTYTNEHQQQIQHTQKLLEMLHKWDVTFDQ